MTTPSADTAKPPRVPGFDTGRLLGFGASGEVWAATDSGSGAPVALKVLRAGAEADSALRESTLLRRLDHPHVVRLIDVVECGGGPVLVLERAAGGSLAALVGARGPLDPGEVVTMLAPLAGALADLHERGLVHGDVSPGNVLFADDGRPLLADLGVATLLGLPADAYGTPGFSDPSTSAAPVPDGDVHALAAVGWFALTGQAPPPVDLRPPLVATAPGTPGALADVVEAGLDARPDRRPGATTFAARVFDAVPAEPVRLVPTDPMAVAAEVVTHRLRTQVRSAPAPDAVLSPPWWRRRVAVGALAGVLVAALAGVALADRWAGRPSPADSATTAGPTGTESSATESSAPGPSAPGPAGASSGPGARSLGEPTLDPASAVEPISRLRAEAFATGEAAPLLSASAQGSPALAADLQLLADLTAAGLVLDGLSFDVAAPEVLQAAADEARVRVVVTTGAHRRLRPADGVVVAQVPESEPVASELALRVVDGAWRVQEVLTGP